MKLEWGFVGKIMTIIVFGLLVLWAVTPKHFNGYYLSQSMDHYYSIMINWENSWDETAFKTTNPDEALRVYKELKNEKDHPVR